MTPTTETEDEGLYKELISGSLDDGAPEDLGAYRRSMAHDMFPDSSIAQRNTTKMTPHIEGVLSEDAVVDSRNEIGYVTGTDNYMEFIVDSTIHDRSDIPMMTVFETLAACGPCKGSSGGCPGFAPRFTTFHKSLSHMLVISLTLDMKWTFRADKLPTPSKLSPIINRMSMADRMTDALLQRILKRIHAHTNLPYLGAGNCSGCQTNRCTVRKGEKCAHPDKRTYSMEAVGIDCDALHMLLYAEHMPWYYKGTGMLPTYVTRYGGILFGDTEDLQVKVNEAVTVIDSVRDRRVLNISEEPTPQLQRVTTGVLSGSSQYVYNSTDRFIYT